MSVWEDFQATMNNVAALPRMIRESADLLLEVRTVEEIRRAKREGTTGIILGFRNVSVYEDQIDYVGPFKDMGVGIVQLAYNTQNLIRKVMGENRLQVLGEVWDV